MRLFSTERVCLRTRSQFQIHMRTSVSSARPESQGRKPTKGAHRKHSLSLCLSIDRLLTSQREGLCSINAHTAMVSFDTFPVARRISRKKNASTDPARSAGGGGIRRYRKDATNAQRATWRARARARLEPGDDHNDGIVAATKRPRMHENARVKEKKSSSAEG